MHIRDLPKVEAILKDSTGKIDFVVVRFENYKKFVRKCNIEGAINEAEYLARYKDVEKAIQDGKCHTATEHYLNTGYVEQRLAKLSDVSDTTQSRPAPIEELVEEDRPVESGSDAEGMSADEPDRDEEARGKPQKSTGYGTRSARPLPRHNRGR
jgi:hypothetical protein